VPFLLNMETKFDSYENRMHGSHVFLVISALYCITYCKRGVANNYTVCIYENVCVSNFKYNVSFLFRIYLFIFLKILFIYWTPGQ
jgi:hypothetical protein